MLDALERYFPPQATWTKPQGGFFIIATLPDYIDTGEMMIEAVKENVAYVPGSPFLLTEEGRIPCGLLFAIPARRRSKKVLKE